MAARPAWPLQSSTSIFLGDAGNDLLTITGSNDTVVGATGNATIDAVAGSALVRAGTGPVQFNVGSATATLQGGTGPLTANSTGSGNLLVFSAAAPLSRQRATVSTGFCIYAPARACG